MDKPISLSVKDYIVRKMAVKMMVSEKIIDEVLMHQFSSANEALSTNKSIEIAGFGKFYFNDGKANRKYNKMLSLKALYEKELAEADSLGLSEKRIQNLKTRLISAQLMIDNLKPRIDI